jgi:hydroxyacylglutathione hydrolase
MPAAEIHIFRSLSDNCGALIRDPATGRVATVDVGNAGDVAAAARARGWTITDILITHEHGDHIEGVAALKAETGARVSGPRAALDGGAPVDRVVGEGHEVAVGGLAFDVWETPGHSPGHLTYVSKAAKLALVGDVVFVMGCGRIIDGTPEQLWEGVSRIAALPGDTTLITGHDYTLSNARFALAMDPANAALVSQAAEAERRKAAGEFWAVTTVAEERETNPFFRADMPALAAAVGKVGAPPVQVFAALRTAKNTFKG